MKKNLSDVKHFLGTELYEEINKKVEGLKEKNLTQKELDFFVRSY